MEINTRTENEIHIVEIIGNLDTNTSPEAEQQFKLMMDNGAMKIIVDFEKLEYISSAGLRVLLVASKRMKTEDGKIRICNLNETVQEVFDISGFSTILSVYTSLELALEGL